MRETSGASCPVPTEQQPLVEYQELKESWFFGWAARDWRGYLTPMAWILVSSLLVTGPVAAASFPPGKYPLKCFLSGAAGAGFLLGLVLLQLYLGWRYIGSRLSSVTIDYEESGWYDGQSWPKNPEMLARDRLIVAHQIKPILRRQERTFAAIALFFLAVGIAWNFI